MRLFAAFALAVSALAETQLTIYNQNFALVKERRTLDLPAGESEIRITDLTAHLEADSVLLRDRTFPDSVRVLEQNFEGDPLSQDLLLRRCEGKVIEFQIDQDRTVKGKVLRSGYVPHTAAYGRFGQRYAQAQSAIMTVASQPIVEVDGRIQFGLPGKPKFESLDTGVFVKPTLLWRLWTDRAGQHDTELSWLTGGMRWEATYNAVAPEKGDRFDLTGWITLENVSGKDFENASVKLMAGDIERAQQPQIPAAGVVRIGGSISQPEPVAARSFDEYHLYSLPRPTSVLDREIKQVEFVRATAVPAQRIYIYDGLLLGNRSNWNPGYIQRESSFGSESGSKVGVFLEFRNSAAAHLGMPLPRGAVRVYRRDTDARNEFIGEDRIEHTPKDETVRLGLGSTFDITGERRQTNFTEDQSRRTITETFEIKVRNHKDTSVEVRVVEHMYRWHEWGITTASLQQRKLDSRTVEFRPQIPANGEAVITYTVLYRW